MISPSDQELLTTAKTAIHAKRGGPEVPFPKDDDAEVQVYYKKLEAERAESEAEAESNGEPVTRSNAPKVEVPPVVVEEVPKINPLNEDGSLKTQKEIEAELALKKEVTDKEKEKRAEIKAEFDRKNRELDEEIAARKLQEEESLKDTVVTSLETYPPLDPFPLKTTKKEKTAEEIAAEAIASVNAEKKVY